MTNTKLQTDTYYRGYRLSQHEDGLGTYISIWKDADLVEDSNDIEDAKAKVDAYFETAR